MTQDKANAELRKELIDHWQNLANKADSLVSDTSKSQRYTLGYIFGATALGAVGISVMPQTDHSYIIGGVLMGTSGTLALAANHHFSGVKNFYELVSDYAELQIQKFQIGELNRQDFPTFKQLELEVSNLLNVKQPYKKRENLINQSSVVALLSAVGAAWYFSSAEPNLTTNVRLPDEYEDLEEDNQQESYIPTGP